MASLASVSLELGDRVRSHEDSLLCSFPLGHLVLATVGSQDTGLDGRLV